MAAPDAIPSVQAAAGAGAGRSQLRAPGWVLLVCLVVGGMSIGAVVFRARAPALVATWRARRANLPADPEARLDVWLAYGEPMIRERLGALRHSAREHWLVGSRLGTSDGSVQWWGIDLDAWPAPWARREGRAVIVQVPAPRLLKIVPAGTSEVAGTARSGDSPDLGRLREEMLEQIERNLRSPGDLEGGLARDIPGASLEVRMDPQEND